MRRDVRQFGFGVLVGSLLFGASCACGPEGTGTDAGTTKVDSGVIVTADAGPVADAGGTAVDAGSSVVDAGTFDAGTVIVDSGVVIFDAGPVDSGTGVDAGVTVDAGMVIDAGTPFDAGIFDAGCLAIETVDGGCIPLLFSNVCSVPQVTVLHSGDRVDDDAGTQMGAAILANCTTAIPSRTVNWRDAGVLDSVGAPLVGRNDVFVCGGGSFNQLHVGWLENSGATFVRDTSTSEVASFSLRDGGMVFNDSTSNLSPSLDYFVLELAHTRPGGPLTVVGYGMYGPGTTAAAYYFETAVMPNLSTHNETWYVVRWADLDADGLPSQPAEFTVLGSGH